MSTPSSTSTSVATDRPSRTTVLRTGSTLNASGSSVSSSLQTPVASSRLADPQIDPPTTSTDGISGSGSQDGSNSQDATTPSPLSPTVGEQTIIPSPVEPKPPSKSIFASISDAANFSSTVVAIVGGILAIVVAIYTILNFVSQNHASALADWNAKKDHQAHCLTLKEANEILSKTCRKALEIDYLPAPPRKRDVLVSTGHVAFTLVYRKVQAVKPPPVPPSISNFTGLLTSTITVCAVWLFAVAPWIGFFFGDDPVDVYIFLLPIPLVFWYAPCYFSNANIPPFLAKLLYGPPMGGERTFAFWTFFALVALSRYSESATYGKILLATIQYAMGAMGVCVCMGFVIALQWFPAANRWKYRRRRHRR